jgi:hypothetical protein
MIPYFGDFRVNPADKMFLVLLSAKRTAAVVN